jgi:transcription elongation factor SPT6
VDPRNVIKKGQTIQGVVIEVKTDLSEDAFLVELSSRPSDVAGGDTAFRSVKHDDAWNLQRSE